MPGSWNSLIATLLMLLTEGSVSPTTAATAAVSAAVPDGHVGVPPSIAIGLGAHDDTEQAHNRDETHCSDPHGGTCIGKNKKRTEVIYYLDVYPWQS